jgi:hypothetical protein
MNATDLVSMPVPGAARLRSLTPVWSDEGGCVLLHDLERDTVVEVPLELQPHIAQALETGDLDEELLGWLATVGLWTGESETGGRSRPRRGRVGVIGCGHRGWSVASADLVRRAMEGARRFSPR